MGTIVGVGDPVRLGEAGGGGAAPAFPGEAAGGAGGGRGLEQHCGSSAMVKDHGGWGLDQEAQVDGMVR